MSESGAVAVEQARIQVDLPTISSGFKTAAGVRGLYYVIQFTDGFMLSKVKPSFTVIHRSNEPAFHLWLSYPTDQPMNKFIGSKQISFGICFALLTFLFYIIIDDRLPWKFKKSGLTSSKEQHMFKPEHATSDSTTSTATTPTTSSLLPLNWTKFPQTLPLLSGQTRVCSDYVFFSNGFKDGRRLGNQIFNYAVGFYVAELTGRRVGFQRIWIPSYRCLDGTGKSLPAEHRSVQRDLSGVSYQWRQEFSLQRKVWRIGTQWNCYR